MSSSPRRYRAFISYSRKNKAVAKRLHRALETYRLPKGIKANVGADRRLGRFFRDDDEMGASQSLSAALKGALDDAQALIVLCSPASARSVWVDAEVRHFKSRQSGRVYAVVIDGEPNASRPERECFAPALKFKIGTDGLPTGERDEPRAPDLRSDGMASVRAQLAAGLLGLPFDDLWQRDRRRTRRWRAAWATAAVVMAAVLGTAGIGWRGAQRATRLQAAAQAVAEARIAVADGRTVEALKVLTPHLQSADTRPLVEAPLRAMLAWMQDPRAAMRPGSLQPMRLRDATVLVDPGRGAYDISDVGLQLRRLIRSKDGHRIIAIGDQRVVLIDAQSGARLAALENRETKWLGHAFEAPSGLIVVTGGIFGPTNGSVWPFMLAVSADGKSVQAHQVDAHMFWGSAVGVDRGCDTLQVASQEADGRWRIERRTLGAQGLPKPVVVETVRLVGEADAAAVARLAQDGPAAVIRTVFMGESAANPFTGKACSLLGADEGERGGGTGRAQVAVIDVGSSIEPSSHWTDPAPAPPKAAALPAFKECTEAKPCAVVGGNSDEHYARETPPGSPDDSAGWLPQPRWAAPGTSVPPVFFEHLVFNSGHQLAVCRPSTAGTACLVQRAQGEDQSAIPMLRSVDGRFLYWPFGGTVFDLVELRQLTPLRGIPMPLAEHHDFEFDRNGLTVAVEARLVTYLPDAQSGEWRRQDDERASARYGVLESAEGGASLLSLASLGDRQYLAVRSDGVLARLDARQGSEVWRAAASGLGKLAAVHLDPKRGYALLMGDRAWRVFRVSDGFPVSGLLLPPAAAGDAAMLAQCRIDGALNADGSFVSRCAEQARLWRPGQARDVDLLAAGDSWTCAADPGSSALETIRRCYAK